MKIIKSKILVFTNFKDCHQCNLSKNTLLSNSLTEESVKVN